MAERPQALPVNAEAVPDLLKQSDCWLVWRYVEDRDPETSEADWDKPPLCARNLTAGSSTNRKTWCPFAEALDAYRRHGLDGIGFALCPPKGDGERVVGVDLDRCRDPQTGELAPWAAAIVARLNTYTEVSPSGTGLRMFLLGKLPPQGRKKGDYENYEAGRYVTVTGQHVEGTPLTIERRQEEIEAVHREVWPPAPQNESRPASGYVPDLADAELVSKARRMKNGAGERFARLFFEGDTSGFNSRSEADLSLCNYLAFFCGPNAERIADLFSQSALMRSKWNREDYRRRTIEKALAGRSEFYAPGHRPRGRQSGARPFPDGQTGHTPAPANESEESYESSSPRPTITITTEEHEVNAAAVAALARDKDIYQRGGLLARVVRDVSPAAKGIRRPFAPRIEPLPPPLLRERLAANASWITLNETKKDGVVETPAHPPGWCVSAVHARADWPGIRHLEAVVDYPVLRPDGTILGQPGYDLETGLLLETTAALPSIPECPSKEQAVAARDRLLEVASDFPFERPVHRAAWLAALLTPLARFAFAGPAPLFLVDANVRAAGKGLLLDCISRVTTGERFTIATYTDDEDELRKRILALALGGDRLVLFDNLTGKFGNGVLDAALTGTSFKDRVLGVNRMAEAPLYMTWYATGNNVAIAADTARRVCHIRLESPEERPEERQGFRYPNLLAWVGQNRAALLADALTILRGYCAAGRPDQGLPAWGSFEGWSALVRSAVVWSGLPDPGETRLLLQAQADVAAESMGVLLRCWEQMDPERRGLTAAEVVGRLRESSPESSPDYQDDLRDALEALLGKLDARLLGNKLRSYRRRIFGGRFIDQAGTHNRAARWAAYPAEAFGRRAEKTHETHETHTGNPQPGQNPNESYESYESFSPAAESAISPGDGGDGQVRVERPTTRETTPRQGKRRRGAL
jgi:hypothetical protein